MHLRMALCLSLAFLFTTPLLGASPSGQPYRHLVAEPLSEHAKMSIAMRMCYVSKTQDKDFVELKQAVGAAPCSGGFAAGFPCHNVDLMAALPIGQLGTSRGSDLWGWTDPETGAEIAIYNMRIGTAFVDVTEPSAPVHLGTLPVPGEAPVQGDVKVYRDHAYIVGERVEDHGMQVFDLRRLRDVANPPETFTADAHYLRFGRAHNLAINEDTGFAYGVSTTTCSDGLHVVDLSSPQSPQFAGCVDELGFVHDAQCVSYQGPDPDHQGSEICFNAGGVSLAIHDVSDKSAPVLLSEIDYQGRAFVHQGWLTEDHAYFLLGDEGDEIENGNRTRTYIFDVRDLDRPFLAGAHTSESASIDHNLYVAGDYVFEANYASGLRILHLEDPASGTLSEAGYFDVVPHTDSAQFGGAWSSYPYFKSGTVVISTISQGLFIVRPTFDFQSSCDLPLGHDDYCQRCGPCEAAQGGCKSDDDCVGNLLCAEGFGAQFGMAGAANVCVEPGSLRLDYQAAELTPPNDGADELVQLHARDVNNQGQVAGWASSADGSRHVAFRFTPGLGMELIEAPGTQSSEALAINESGEVFGRLVRIRANGSVAQTGLFHYREGGELDLLRRRSNRSIRAQLEMRDVNDSGDVVGALKRNREPRRVPYLYTENEGWIRLAALDERLAGRSVLPVAVNNVADVLLTTVPQPDGTQEAFLLHGGELTQLGDFGHPATAALAMNDKSHVAGYSETADRDIHAYSVKLGKVLSGGSGGGDTALVDLHRGAFTSSFAGWVSSRGVVGGVLDDEALFTYDPRRRPRVKVGARRADFVALLDAGAELSGIAVVDMNDRLEFVGRVEGRLDGEPVVRFFYFSPAVGVLDLGEVLAEAGINGSLQGVSAINDQGALLLQLDEPGHSMAAVLTPVARPL